MIHTVIGLNPLALHSGIGALNFRMKHWKHTDRCMDKGGGLIDDKGTNLLI
jgi:hypothetical protein